MILVVAVASWIVVSSLVMVLCAAARSGDSAQLERASGAGAWGRGEALAWGSSRGMSITVRANARTSETDTSPLRGGGVTA